MPPQAGEKSIFSGAMGRGNWQKCLSYQAGSVKNEHVPAIHFELSRMGMLGGFSCLAMSKMSVYRLSTLSCLGV